MPDPLDDFAHRVRGAEHRERIDAAMVEVLAALTEDGVDALALKGAVIARWLYGEDEVRGYSDCDLLADPDRFATAGRTLARLGFHQHIDEATHPEVWEEGRSQVWHRNADEVWVDLQWRLAGVGLAPAEAWKVLWPEREAMDLGDAFVVVASEPARALHLALAVAGSPEMRKAQLDLERGVSRLVTSVWRDAAGLAERLDATPAMAEGLRSVPGGAELLKGLEVEETL